MAKSLVQIQAENREVAALPGLSGKEVVDLLKVWDEKPARHHITRNRYGWYQYKGLTVNNQKAREDGVEFFCPNCSRRFKTLAHFNRYVNRKLPNGMRCEPGLWILK